MKFTPPASPDIRVRRRIREAFGTEHPSGANEIYQSLVDACNGRCQLSFSTPCLPPTLNHMYEVRGRGKRVLTAQHQEFRQLAAIAMGSSRLTWQPKGHVAALIFMQSPHWITKRGTLRNMDGDNRIKPIFDAVQAATGANDCAIWQMHVYKVATALVKTSVYLFDLGDVIDYFP